MWKCLTAQTKGMKAAELQAASQEVALVWRDKGLHSEGKAARIGKGGGKGACLETSPKHTHRQTQTHGPLQNSPYSQP